MLGQLILLTANNFRIRYALLLTVTIVTAILECMSVIYISPLVKSLSSDNMSIQLIFTFLSIVVASGFFKISLTYFQNKVSFESGVFINQLLLNKLLSTPVYELEKQQKSTVVATIQLKCQNVIYGIFLPLFSIFANMFLIIFVFTYLVIYDWVSTLLLFSAITTIIGITLIMIRKKLQVSGAVVAASYDRISERLLAVLSNIREIRIYGKEKHFINDIILREQELRAAQSFASIISNVPRSILETSGLVILLLLAATSGGHDAAGKMIALLATMGFAAQKMLPSAQQIFNNLTTLYANLASAADVLDDLNAVVPSHEIRQVSNQVVGTRVFALRVEDVSCSYDGNMLFKPVSFDMVAGEITTFTGASGVGKSSLLLTLSGLLRAHCGKLQISTSHGYMDILPEMVSYASQSSVLENKNVYENIALSDVGYDKNKIDDILVGLHLYDELLNLKDGLNTLLGESGNLLSGGQKQRVVIARALYFDRPLLILDEVTSSLNQELETIVLTYIKNSSSQKLILTSAHRQKAIDISDHVVRLER